MVSLSLCLLAVAGCLWLADLVLWLWLKEHLDDTVVLMLILMLAYGAIVYGQEAYRAAGEIDARTEKK